MKVKEILKRTICITMAAMMLPIIGGCNKKKTASSGEAVTVKWYIPMEKQADMALVNEEVNKITMDKLGFKVDMQLIDSAAYTERMNMNMASGDDYDICWIGYLNMFDNAVSKGGLMKLDELLEKTPELKKSVPDYLWEQCKFEGSTYVVPCQQIAADTMAVWYKKELADKYNFDMSKVRKTEDLEPFLEIIAKNEPNIYPFCTGSGVNSFRSLDEEVMKNGEVLVAAAKDEETGKYKAYDGLEYANVKYRAGVLHDWYKKGYIRKDVATVKSESTDMKAGKYACWVSGWKPSALDDNQKKYDYELGCHVISKSFKSANAGTGAALAIGRNAKNPEEAIKLIELLNTDVEFYNLVCFGIEGKHYNKLDDGKIELVEESGYNPNACWKFGNQFNAYLMAGQADDVWEQTKKLNDEAIETGLESFMFNKDNVKNIIAKLENVVAEYITVRQGVRNPEEYWDEYKQKLYDNGLQTYIDEYQKQLDEYFKQ